MENITSRKNPYIVRLRNLTADARYRAETREFVCDGLKMMEEAAAAGREIRSVLWKEAPSEAASAPFLKGAAQYCCPKELFDYASPMVNSPGPVFTVAMPEEAPAGELKNAIVLENVQDPGNVGTVIRTAAAFETGAVILCGSCADVYNPKTVRSTMGAIFRQRVIAATREEVRMIADENGLKLFGAVLSDRAKDIRDFELKEAIVAVGSEGKGLSREFIEMCDREIIIPMSPQSESLNAAVAASVIMWEMYR